MPVQTGRDIARATLREIGRLDPIEAGDEELLSDTLAVINRLLDSWRTKGLIIAPITVHTYSLAASTQAYTIGSGATFNQTYPESILSWSVIPDDDASSLQEIPMGRPVTALQWQAIPQKSTTGAYPTVLWFDRAFNSSGYGTCSFYPIPDNGDVDVKLYCKVPEVTALVAADLYLLRPGFELALVLNGAMAIARRHGAEVTADLRADAKDALASFKASNLAPVQGRMRPEFASIGGGGRSVNLRTGDGI